MKIVSSLSLQVMEYKELEKIIFTSESFPEESTINIDKRQKLQEFISRNFSLSTLEECTLVYIALCMNSTLKADVLSVLGRMRQFVGMNAINSIEKLKDKDIIEQKGLTLEFKK